ncbi:MAG: 4Fe-4S dicluster domain-containing protein [Anaerolineae bacterium]|jgi:formate dehydrogenase (coenzyme F420) beta subunit
MSQEIQQAIRIRASELLALGEVGCVIGHERSQKGRVRPFFAYDEADAQRLVWDQTCQHNLVVYLREQVVPTRRRDAASRVAVIAKPCDVRALNVLLHEGQVTRDQVFVIGVACPGILDGDHLQEHCQRCKERVPVFYDALVGEPPKTDVPEQTWADVDELEARPPAERLAFWLREFDRCIRCYACRQACPGCYCFECLAEQVDPLWVSIAHGVPQKAFFHVMRAYHLAGRCVECHACDFACPMHIPLSLLNRKIAKEVEILFGHVSGGDPEKPPPLATFRKDEELPL